MSSARFLLLAAVGVVLISIASATAPVSVPTNCTLCTTSTQYTSSCTATQNTCLNNCGPTFANCLPWGNNVITLVFALVVGLISLIITLLLLLISVALLSGLYNLLLALLCLGINILYLFFLNIIDGPTCITQLTVWLSVSISQLTAYSTNIAITVAINLCISIVQSFYNQCIPNL